MDRVMKTATSKVRYEDKVLKPMGEQDRKDGDEVEIIVQGSATSRIFGIVKCRKGLEEAHEDYKMGKWQVIQYLIYLSHGTAQFLPTPKRWGLLGQRVENGPSVMSLLMRRMRILMI
jgi:predicted DNA-binding antitoxin AbrB/MazE fold protein